MNNSPVRIDGLTPDFSHSFRFKVFQKQDLARAALHDGVILSWDTGLGKTIALFSWPLLKCGFTRHQVENMPHTAPGSRINQPSQLLTGECIVPKGPVLIIAPGDLHQQIADEGWKHFKVRVTPLDSQASFMQRVTLPNSARVNIGPDGRPVLAPGFYITSYTQLSTNGVASIPDPDDCDDPRALLEQFCLKLGDHRDTVRKGSDTEKKGLSGRPLPADWPNRPDFQDVCHYFSWRHVAFHTLYARLSLDPEDTLADLATAETRERSEAERISDPRIRGRAMAEIDTAKDVLINLMTTRPCPTFAQLSTKQQDFVIRKFLADRFEAYGMASGCTKDYPIGEIPEGYIAGKPETDTRPKYRVKCVYSPSLADLSFNAFDAVVIDEGVKMKGEDTMVGRGVRSMEPFYRMILTATPVKNRLPDIFRLAWWAAGGKADAHPRWPYMDDSAEREKFAETFMVSERNISREERALEKGESVPAGRFKKLTPEVCNVHRLWKLLGPIVLRRRKQDTGEDIVPRHRHVIRCEMGTLQHKVYRYHLKTEYLDKNDEEAIGAKLQALRMAAADPSSLSLKEQRSQPTENCACLHKVDVNGTMVDEADPACPKCNGEGEINLPVRSGTAYIPKMATCLTLIQEILERKEQVVVFSAFNDPLDHLGQWLEDAHVRYVKLDGRVSQKKRGQLASVFKRGRTAAPPSNASAKPIPVMLAGVECMAEGHSFHLANNVILIAYSWAYDKFKQALDRVHRMTSTKPVNVYVILCTGTIDAKLESMVQDKGDAAELVLDGRLIGERTEEVNLAELLRVAHREFDDKTKTIDEALLQAKWPALRDKLYLSMQQWDEGAGVPVASPIAPNATYTPRARALRYATPARVPTPLPPQIEAEPSTAPRFEIPDGDVQTSVTAAKPGQPAWKIRIAERAARLAKAKSKSSNLWNQL